MRILAIAAALVAAAVAGGSIALAGAVAFDLLEKSDSAAPSVGGSVAVAPADFERGQALSIRDIYRRSGPGVVQITSTTMVAPEDPVFGFPLPEQSQEALGSGFVMDRAGHVITNFHVIDGAAAVEVSFSDNESLKADIVGTDPSTDIALLKVNASARALTPLELGDSDVVQVGDPVVAIGNPFGLERSVTEGIVSALQRQITSPSQSPIDRVIQTDAAINPGNSGGPLINTQNEVIGVNTQIATAAPGVAGNIGIGFAVPINTVKDVAAQLLEKGRVEHAFLGVRVQELTPEIAELFRLPVEEGLLVADVEEGSPAAKAGIRAGENQVVVAGQSWVIGGDVLVEADDEQLETVRDLRSVLAGKQPGDPLKLEHYRDDERITVEVELGRQPASSQG